MEDFLRRSNEVKAAEIIRNLERRSMEGFYCETREEAVSKVLEQIDREDCVSWGGSMTLDQIGIKDLLKGKNYRVIDRDAAADFQERVELMRRGMLCDCYLTSTNALTLDGELVNIDYNGNRVGAMCFGPKKVVIVAGMNKVVQNVEAGIQRIRTEACVPNCIRFNKSTPCATTGKCGECVSPQTLCGQILITRFSMVKNRIKVIIVGESLGW